MTTKRNPTELMKNLMVAVDAKASDAALLQMAKTLAPKFDAKVWILHVAPPDPAFVGYEVGPRYLRDIMAGELRHEHRLLQSYAAELHPIPIEAEALLIQGPTIEMILAETRKLRIDLLIMGSHRHGLLYEMFIGHTANRILKDAHIPVLIIPMDDAN